MLGKRDREISFKPDQTLIEEKLKVFLNLYYQEFTLSPDQYRPLYASKINDYLICQICADFCWDPRECSNVECNKIFCAKCINEWQLKSNICPNCSREDGTRPVGRVVRKLF
jgi:hypothetical protein